MSIETMYPSRNQSRAENPLFARKRLRQRLGVMLAGTTLGLGLLLLQFIPITAHADAASSEVKSPLANAMAPFEAHTPASKAIRQIQIYSGAN